jgi:transcriptional regulator with XRE-family HTH domain
MSSMATTRNLAEIIRRRLASDATLAAAVEAERLRADIGAAIFEARTRAGLTQEELADLVEMHQSAIARLEDADYDGHSLRVLRRIAVALGKRVHVAFVDQYLNLPSTCSEEFTLRFPAWSEEETQWKPSIKMEPTIPANDLNLVG